jgi:DnaJ-domain-containing protein 1
MWLRLLVALVLLAAVLWWVLRPRRLPGAGAREAPAVEWDPHAVLGVPTGASPDEVARAYREQMKRYHPDRVADMPAEFQELAHRKALEIQRAYAELGGGR